MSVFFDDKIVWITGASSGIGESLAYEFARQGAKLILSARNEKELNRVKDNCSSTPENIFILPLDLTLSADIESRSMIAMAKWGRIDYLVNNAGIASRGPVVDTEMEVYRKIMETNFFGSIALTKAVLPAMLSAKKGHIVVVSSMAGKLGSPLLSTYSSSKHALHGFFDALRSEIYQDNISVTLICPGYIHTNISYNAVAADGSKFGKMDENQANGMSPDECAKRIVEAIYHEKQEVYMGGKEVLGVYLKRFFPRILSKILRGQMPK